MTADSLDAMRARFPASFTQTGSLRKIGIAHPPSLEAILFFHESMREWVLDTTEFDSTSRVTELASAVLTDLSIVCISLGEDDDAQVIFETLNGHGAELHATDLIRNFIFMRAGNDASNLYNNLWSQFEAPLWSELQSRGRLSRPRLEWFVQTAVQAQAGEEIDVGRLYAGYRRFVDGPVELRDAAAQLSMLNRYGEHYKSLITGSGTDPIATFGRRMAFWDASPTHALSLRVAASNLPPDEQVEIFTCIESYVVRRAICGLSRKNYNKVFMQQLRRLLEGELNAASFRSSLSNLTGDASRWPSNDEFRKEWLTGAVFPDRLDAAKLRAIFHRLETAMRSELSEERVLLSLESLDIDHVMPQSWYSYWPLQDGTYVTPDEARDAAPMRFFSRNLDRKTEAIHRRQDVVPRIGNLTLVHYGVNRGLQNHSFDRKRKSLFEHSNLQLNRRLMQRDSWDEAAVAKRGDELFSFALEIWPGPG
jgi:hypothetical protein